MGPANMVTVDITTVLENRGDYWAGYIEQLGTTVYGDTREDTIDEVHLMVDFFFKHHPLDENGVYHEEWLKEYFDYHNVPYEVRQEAGPIPPQGQATLLEQRYGIRVFA